MRQKFTEPYLPRRCRQQQLYRDGTALRSIEALTAGTYRVAINYTDGKMYIKRTSPTASPVYSVDLPTGYSTTNLRPLLMAQGGYDYSSGTLTGFTIGSGGLY